MYFYSDEDVDDILNTIANMIRGEELNTFMTDLRDRMDSNNLYVFAPIENMRAICVEVNKFNEKEKAARSKPCLIKTHQPEPPEIDHQDRLKLYDDNEKEDVINNLHLEMSPFKIAGFNIYQIPLSTLMEVYEINASS
jgi:hypothetical protein